MCSWTLVVRGWLEVGKKSVFSSWGLERLTTSGNISTMVYKGLSTMNKNKEILCHKNVRTPDEVIHKYYCHIQEEEWGLYISMPTRYCSEDSSCKAEKLSQWLFYSKSQVHHACGLFYCCSFLFKPVILLFSKLLNYDIILVININVMLWNEKKI